MVKKILELLRTLHVAAGIKWELLAVFVSIVLERADWVYGELVKFQVLPGGREEMIFGFPSWILSVTAILGFLFVWMFRYAHKLRVQIQKSRVELSILRKRGVELRNKGGNKLSTNSEFESWCDEITAWQQKVYEAIREISVADAEWFEIMDIVPKPRLKLEKPVNQEAHPKRYREHDFQLERLGQMIRDLWGK